MRRVVLDGELTLRTTPHLLEQFETIWSRLRTLRHTRLHLDMSNVTFVSPTASTLLTTAIRRLQQQQVRIELTPPSDSRPHTYLNRIGFYDRIGVEMEYPWQRRDPGGRFVEIVQARDEEEGEAVVGEMLGILRNRNVADTEAIYDALQYALLEVVNNVFHHAQSPTHAFLCAQFYPGRRRVELAVADTGRGIPATLRDNPELEGTFETDAEAIHLAVQPRVTGRPAYNTGEGLFFTMEFIKRNGGDACIHSQRGMLWVRDGEEQVEEGPHWQGTWVALRFRTDHPVNTREIFDSYAPPETDYGWLFEEESPF